MCEIVWFLAFGLFVSLYDSQIDVKDCVWFSVFMFPEFVVPEKSLKECVAFPVRQPVNLFFIILYQ